MKSDSRAVFVGKGIIVFTWVLLFSIAGLATGEYLLAKKRAAKTEARKHLSQKPRLIAVREAYEAFTIQHLHPIYLFFYPFDHEDRFRISNEIVSVNDDGFRGAPVGPADDRKIAVVLGGSTAFGHYASSDETTITGYLNAIQDRYHFLNAGVPSWNSTQELFRLAYQVVELEPAIVIAFDGANDATILHKYAEEGIDYPPGTPESFNTLSELVDGIRSGEAKHGGVPAWYERRLPELTRVVRKRLAGDDDRKGLLEDSSDDWMKETAAKYVLNLILMQQLSEANGAKFIGIFQPIRSLHRNVADTYKNSDRVKYFTTFHRDVLSEYERRRSELEFHDFATIFDEDFDEIPVYDKYGEEDLNGEMIFADSVHLLDRGNEIVARRIWSLVGETEAREELQRDVGDGRHAE